MHSGPSDRMRFTVVSSIVFALGFLSPTALADPRATLIRNAALVLTMDPALGQGELGTIADADILVVGDTIAAIGKHLPGHGAAVVDATGMIVMPGFVDTHNHLWQSLIRGCGSDGDLTGWLAAGVFPLSRYTFSPADATTSALAPCGSTRLRTRLSTNDGRSALETSMSAFCSTVAMRGLASHVTGAKYGPMNDGRVPHQSPVHSASR